MSKRYKGKFKILNPKKYMGNPTNIIYRSLWELKLMMYLDEQALEWAKALGDGVEETTKIVHRDVNGVILEAGDSVVLTKD